MKCKLKVFASIACCVLLCLCFINCAAWGYVSPPAEHTTTIVYTPIGSAITVDVYSQDYSEGEISALNAYCDVLYPNATRTASSSGRYNCHAYALYGCRAGDSFLFCMENPSSYFIDGSLTETDRLHADIICYFESDNFCLHSGRVLLYMSGTPVGGNLADANLVTVSSKWCDYGVYTHCGNYCPYAGDTAYIKYFSEYINHTPTYSFSSTGNTQHTKNCVHCSASITENHTILYNKGSLTMHTKYCASCNYSLQETHSWVRYNDMFFCSECQRVAAFIPIAYDGLNQTTLLSLNELGEGTALYVDSSRAICCIDGQYYILIDVENLDTWGN